MIEYLEKKKLVYRKSCNYYEKVFYLLCILKLSFTSSCISSYFHEYQALALLPLVSALIEMLEKLTNINQRVEQYKLAVKFYSELLNKHKANTISEQEIYLKELEYIKQLDYSPREKYLKQTNSNGYAFSKP